MPGAPGQTFRYDGGNGERDWQNGETNDDHIERNHDRDRLAPFLVGVGGLAVNTLFYLALPLMMGVLADGRGKLLGVTLGMLFGGMLAANLLGTVALYTPWSMTTVLPAAALGVPLPVPVWVPVATTAGLTLVCIAVAVWRFGRMEF